MSESHAIAVMQIYPALDPPVPGFRRERFPVTITMPRKCLRETWKLKAPVVGEDIRVIDDRLLLAGVRLAALLNALQM